MSGLLRHARIRLRETVTHPWSLVRVLAAGAATLIYSPSTPLAGQLAPDQLLMEPLMVGVWLWLWPWWAVRAVSGQVFTVAGGRTVMETPCPALPVGRYARPLAEALLVVALVLVVRIPGFFLGALSDVLPAVAVDDASGLPHAVAFAPRWVVDALIYLPVAVAAAAPARSKAWPFLRPIFVALLTLGARQLGWLADPLPAIAVTGGLLVVALLLVRHEPEMGGGTRPQPTRAGPAPAVTPDPRRSRPAMEPVTLFRRDVWRQPLRQSPSQVVLLVLAVVAIGIFEALDLVREPLYTFAAALAFGLLLTLVVFRPLGSPLAVVGSKAGSSVRGGAFLAACAALPLPRRVVLRGVFVHGWLASAAVWGLVVGMSVVRGVVDTGGVALLDMDGDSIAWMLLPVFLLTPALGALLTCGAAGDRIGSGFVGGLLLAYLPVQLAVHLICERSLGIAGTPTLLAIAMGWAALASAAAMIPALRHLRMPAARFDAVDR